MRWVQSGRTAHFPIQFEVEGEIVVATSLDVTLIHKDGSEVALPQSFLPGTDFNIQVDAAHLSLADGARYEPHTLLVQFGTDRGLREFQVFFMVSERLPIVVTPHDVRSLLGLTGSELPDADIDLPLAYFDLLDTYGSELDDVFAQSGFQFLAANHAVVARAALMVIPSLKLRIAQTQKAEDQTFTRFAGTDLELLQAEIQRNLTEYLDQALKREATPPTFLLFGTPTDAITGE